MKCRRNRAFATVAALALVGIVGVVLATLTGMFARDVKRSLRQQDDAQLRQLLIAGEIAAREPIVREGGQVTVKLPEELGVAGMSVTCETASGNDGIEVRVTARAGDGRSLSQMLRYEKNEHGWQLKSATEP